LCSAPLISAFFNSFQNTHNYHSSYGSPSYENYKYGNGYKYGGGNGYGYEHESYGNGYKYDGDYDKYDKYDSHSKYDDKYDSHSKYGKSKHHDKYGKVGHLTIPPLNAAQLRVCPVRAFLVSTRTASSPKTNMSMA
jgi:hypothetical protein